MTATATTDARKARSAKFQALAAQAAANAAARLAAKLATA